MKRWSCALSWAFCVFLVGFAGAWTAMADVTYDFYINTSSISASTGYMDLQLDPGYYPNSPPTLDVAIQNFSTDGTMLVDESTDPSDSNLTPSGDVSGSLLDTPTDLSFDDGTMYNDYTAKLVFGSYISFSATLSGAATMTPQTDGDTFALDFFDTSGNSLLSAESMPSGYAFVAGMLLVNPDTTITPIVAPGESLPPTDPANNVDPAVVTITIPEPSSIWLFAAGLGSLGLLARKSKWRNIRVG